MGVTVTFLSLLELLKEALIELTQGEAYSPIHVRAATNVKAVPDLPMSSEFDEPVDSDDDLSESS
jgi:segregation and condensation protein A